MASPQEIAEVLREARLPEAFRRLIPEVTQLLAEITLGTQPAPINSKLLPLFSALRGQELPFPDGSIVVHDVSGTGIAIGHGATVIKVDIHLPDLPPSLHQLRAPLEHFVDRQEEIESLIQALIIADDTEGRNAIARISGLGGIGKTELAYMVANRVRTHFPDAQLVVDMRGSIGGRQLNPEQALLIIIRNFIPLHPPSEDVPQLVNTYRSQLHGKRVLILADDTLDATQVQPLTPPPGSALLITSRQAIELPDLQPEHLYSLPLEHATALLLSICPRIDSYAERLAKLCGNLPLALRVSATFLRGRPQRDVSQYLRSLAAERRRLKQLREPRDPKLNVEASLRLSYDALTPTVQAALRQLGVFTSPFDPAAAEGTIESMGDQLAGELLEELQHYSLLEYDAQLGRYELHELVRIFALDRLQEAGEEYQTRLRHARFYVQRAMEIRQLFDTGGQSMLQALRLFDLDRPRISSGWRWARNQKSPNEVTDELLVDYGFATMTIGELRYHPETDRLNNFSLMLEAARRLNKQNRVGIALFNLGRVYAALGEFHKAIEYFQQDLEITRMIGNRKGEGIAIGNLGLAYSELGDYQKAVALHQQNLNIARDIRNRKGESIALGNLGYALTLAGNPVQALIYHQEQLEIAKAMQNRFEESVAKSSMGLALIESGAPKDALSWLDQALTLAQELGDRATEGRILDRQGRAYAVLGEPSQALMCYDQSIVIARDLGDAAGEARTKWRKGLVLVYQNDIQRGAALMQEAVDYRYKIGHLEAERRAEYLATIPVNE